MSEPIVSVKCMRHVYPDRTEVSLCGVEIAVQPGEIVAVLAANGAGKTTLLQHITGMLRPLEGSVRVFGLDPYEDFEKVRTRLGVVFQNPAEQIIGPTVGEDIAFGLGHLKLSRQEQDARVQAISQRLGIDHLRGKVPHYLSGGEVKKVALAGALVTGPELLVLDEPFAELDVGAVKDLVELLRSVSREEGAAIVFTSHQLEPVALLADTVYVLNKGQVAAKGKPIEVFQQQDILEQSRLRAPDLFRLVDLLRQGGLDIHPDLDVRQVAAQIIAASGV
ncbi:MAG: energy-coupling factor ABC transporter ATP-binding protein [Eubacteriales bacterium]|nr:energy-coupling factor ABC transporter ATP-binding protein [Eubacteriales bacterium]